MSNSSPDLTGNRSFAWALPLALILAAALRIEYLREFLGTPFADHLFLDAEWFTEAAKKVARGEPLTAGGAYFRPPFYPFFVGAFFRIFEDNLLAPRMAQSVLGLLQVVLVHRIALRTHGAAVAAVASFLAATYGMFIYFEGEFLTATLGTFLTTAATALLLEGAAQRRAPLFLLAGLAIGLAAITHGSAAPLAVPAVVWTLAGRGRGGGWGKAIAVAFGVLLPLAAVTARNYVVGGEWVAVGTQGGINFYVGNNAESDGKAALAPGVPEAEHLDNTTGPYRDSIDLVSETLAERDLGRELRPGEVSAYWFGRAFEWMRDHPSDALVHGARKAYYFISGYEISNNRDFRDQARRFTPILRGFLGQLALLMPLALFGLLPRTRRSFTGTGTRGRSLLVALVVTHGLTLTAFFVCSRYRQPAVVWWLPFAAAGLVMLIRDLRDAPRDAKRALASVACVALFAVVTNGRLVAATGLADVTEERDAPFHRFNLGAMYDRAGQTELALAEYRQAVDHGIADPRLWLNLANCYVRTGNAEEARAAYQRVLQIAPDFASVVHANLGVLAARSQDWDEAIAQFEECLRTDPTHGPALEGLGAACLAAGRVDGAIVAFQRALVLREGSTAALRRGLAAAYLQAGLDDEAEKECRRALVEEPQSVALLLQLARIHVHQERPEDAEAVWAQARALAPGSLEVERIIAEDRWSAP